ANPYFIEVCAIESFICKACSLKKKAFEEDAFDKLMASRDEEEIVEGDSAEAKMYAMAQKMKAKFDKYWGKIEKMNMMVLLGCGVGSRCKMRLIRFCYGKLYDDFDK
ncbi:hypothetical protein Dimus_036799, partial [Dionaea muscipula]